MPSFHDVVIVGARCAGATLATSLARAGASVLLVDKSRLPSELVLSTHTVHPSGMRALDELGVGASVRAHSPEMQTLRFDWHGGRLDLRFKPGQGEYCPRRKRFDALLQDAAQSAGAKLRDQTRATALVMDGQRVRGIVLQTSNGQRETVHAGLVVGADGRHSRIAQWVGAEEYLGYDAPRGLYWGYFPAPRGWGRSAEYPGGMYLYRRGNTIRIAFHSDDDQLLIGTLPLKAALAPFRADALQALTDAVRADPLLTEAVSRAPTEPVRGFAGDRYFFRRAVGPGWLLLGDAGHHKDFLSGDGMSEALLSARRAAAAILAALGASTQRDASRALERFWRQRDVEALPLFYHAHDLAEPDVGGRLDGAVFDELNAGPESARERFAGIFTRATSPYESVPAALALRVAASRMLRGDLRVFAECVRRARRTRQVAQEQQRCRALLDACLPGFQLR